MGAYFDYRHIQLFLLTRARLDQRYCDFDRIVVGSGKELDRALDGVMQARAYIRDFRDPHCTPLQICRTLIEHPF